MRRRGRDYDHDQLPDVRVEAQGERLSPADRAMLRARVRSGREGLEALAAVVLDERRDHGSRVWAARWLVARLEDAATAPLVDRGSV